MLRAWLPPNAAFRCEFVGPSGRGEDGVRAMGVGEGEVGDGRGTRRLLAERDQAAPSASVRASSDIMWFGGHGFDELVVAHHGDQPGRRVGQRKRAVVETGAAAQSDPGAVHRERGHQHHRRRRDRVGGQPRGGRLAQPERRLDQRARPVLAPLQRLRRAGGVVAGDGQQHRARRAASARRQLDRTGFGPDRDIGAHGSTVGDHRGQVRTARRASASCTSAAVHATASRQDRSAHFGLGRRHTTSNDAEADRKVNQD